VKRFPGRTYDEKEPTTSAIFRANSYMESKSKWQETIDNYLFRIQHMNTT
jgi:hypothetical protein